MKHSREFGEILEVLMADANVSLLGTLAFRREISRLNVSDDAPITRVVVDREEKKCERNLVT